MYSIIQKIYAKNNKILKEGLKNVLDGGDVSALTGAIKDFTDTLGKELFSEIVRQIENLVFDDSKRRNQYESVRFAEKSLVAKNGKTKFERRYYKDNETGEIRSKIFYCDPMQSSQKPHVENNHNFIREILPNGQDWSHLTQEKLDLMFSHINSTPRKNLGNKTPYEIFTYIYGEELANKLNIQKILKDEVCTTPRLLK